jgi:hypothetical protein
VRFSWVASGWDVGGGFLLILESNIRRGCESQIKIGVADIFPWIDEEEHTSEHASDLIKAMHDLR